MVLFFLEYIILIKFCVRLQNYFRDEPDSLTWSSSETK